MKKQIICTLTSAAMCLCLFGCGSSDSVKTGTVITYESEDVTESQTETFTESPIESYTESPTEDNQPDILPIEVKEFGYGMSQGKYLYCGVVLYNPNKTIACEFPTYRITARDSDGIILGTTDQTLSILYPEQTVSFAEMAFECEEKPSEVTVEALNVEEYNLLQVKTLEHPDYKPFEIINYAMRDEKVVGEVKNPNDYDCSTVAVTLIFRNEEGKIVGGDITFVDDLKASSTAPFEIRTNSNWDFITDNYELSAQIW